MDARHPGLINALNELLKLADKVARTSVRLDTLAHKIVFALSRVCIEECWEIFLLAANQYEKGASKMLRGLYERTLTLTYISKNPEKAERFQKFAAIQNHRSLQHARRLFAEEDLKEACKAIGVTVDDIEAQYERFKPEFQEAKCDKCKSKKLAVGWDVDLATMAQRTGEELPKFYLSAYVLPTLDAHTTMASALSRTTEDANRVVFDYGPSAEGIDFCVAQTFALIDIVLKTTISMFSLPFKEDLERFEQTAFRVWDE